jgi:undecaprenyl diphosphate synthase
MDELAWEGPLPRHLAIIMDGNGRWAERQGLARVVGHEQGADVVRDIVRTCRKLGIEALTLFAFSAQNWSRPADEVAALMSLLIRYVESERAEVLENGIRFNAIGNLDALPRPVKLAVEELVEASSHGKGMVLTLALSYGGREEIVHAARCLATEAAAGRLEPSSIDAGHVEAALWTHGLPADVDLVIRTSGEQRISNFLLWQLAYAELWFTDVTWPEFTKDHLLEAFAEYGARERRFGQVGAPVRETALC